MEIGYKYAEVYIDIRSLSVDHPFDYIIPAEMLDSIGTGSVVIVPVSNRKEIGYVVRVKDKSNIPTAALKKITGLAGVSPVFDSQMLELAMWMSRYYVQPLTGVLRLFLPPGRKNKKSLQKKGQGYKYRTMIEIDKSAYGRTVNDPGWKRSKAQKRILDMLDRSGGGMMEKAMLLKETSTSADSIKKLIKKGFIKENKQRVRRDFRYGSLPGSGGADIILNQYQRKCIDQVWSSLKKKESRKFLIQGVTGSGKTEIYMNICKKVFTYSRIISYLPDKLQMLLI